MLDQSSALHPDPYVDKDTSLRRFSRPDKIILCCLSVLVALYAATVLKYHGLPFEDAAMLMRYSQHLAQGQGIVFNVGQKPVDGATDFLFMVALAVLAKTGISIEYSAYAIGLLSHLLTTLLVYETIRRVLSASLWTAVTAAVFLALGPGLDYIDMGFGTPFFALFAALAWRFALQLAQQEVLSRSCAFAFASSSLLLGLTRPEGVLLALFMLLGLVYFRGLLPCRFSVLAFAGIIGTLGSAYFLWRWHYFGYPLPNPFYKKGGGHLYLDGLYASAHYVLQMNAVFLLAIAVGLCFKEARRRAIFVLIPIVCFTGIWALLSSEMNHAGRFQYALFPVALMSWPFVLTQTLKDRRFPNWKSLSRSRQTATAIPIGILFLLSLAYQHRALHHEALLRSYHDMNYDMALALKPYQSKGYTIATTEAGIIPLYSHWQAIDLWGLNDQWIAHHTYVSAEYLNRSKPEVIEIHGPTGFIPPEVRARPAGDIAQQWLVMVAILNQYLKDNHYKLVRSIPDTAFRSHYSTGYSYLYYVRPDFAQSKEIAGRLHDLKLPPAWDPFLKSSPKSQP